MRLFLKCDWDVTAFEMLGLFPRWMEPHRNPSLNVAKSGTARKSCLPNSMRNDAPDRTLPSNATITRVKLTPPTSPSGNYPLGPIQDNNGHGQARLNSTCLNRHLSTGISQPVYLSTGLSLNRPQSTLPLLVARIRTHDIHSTLAAHHFTVLADPPHARSHFHDDPSLPPVNMKPLNIDVPTNGVQARADRFFRRLRTRLVRAENSLICEKTALP